MSNYIEDTSRRNPADHILGAMIAQEATGDSTTYITDMEAEGQRQVVASQMLPWDMQPDRKAFMDLGFVLSLPVDDLFCEAVLPEGWTKAPTDHDMWSKIVDERGIERVAIFYKAAFYDRKAAMHLVEVGSSLARGAIWSNKEDIPWDLLTEDEQRDFVDGLKAFIAQCEDEVTGHIYQRDGKDVRARKLLEQYS